MHANLYPGLYSEADSASNRQQKLHLGLIKAEYGLLIVASLFSLWSPDQSGYYVAYAGVIALPFVLLLTRMFLKPDQGWYQARALAESIKTATWKFMMRVEPFSDDQKDLEARANFRNHLRAILETNRHIGHRFDATAATDEQVTERMDAARKSALPDRIAAYLAYRVDDQRGWYAMKAGLNKKWARRAFFACSVLYAVAVVLVAIRIAEPGWQLAHPEPLLVSATALIGWMQIKKFNELAASYTLTAHEIGIIRGRAVGCETAQLFAEFVDDAELAFSREHTQWIARQSH